MEPVKEKCRLLSFYLVVGKNAQSKIVDKPLLSSQLRNVGRPIISPHLKHLV